jgi:hypothetical protein
MAAADAVANRVERDQTVTGQDWCGLGAKRCSL